MAFTRVPLCDNISTFNRGRVYLGFTILEFLVYNQLTCSFRANGTRQYTLSGTLGYVVIQKGEKGWGRRITSFSGEI